MRYQVNVYSGQHVTGDLDRNKVLQHKTRPVIDVALDFINLIQNVAHLVLSGKRVQQAVDIPRAVLYKILCAYRAKMDNTNLKTQAILHVVNGALVIVDLVRQKEVVRKIQIVSNVQQGFIRPRQLLLPGAFHGLHVLQALVISTLGLLWMIPAVQYVWQGSFSLILQEK
jgi:hypothetical protein